MKKIFAYLLCFIPATCFAQYTSSNSIMREAIVLYELDGKGVYQKKTDVLLDEVKDVVSVYGYNKKSQTIYVQTPTSNCKVTLTKEYAKSVKKDKSIPQLKDNEIDAQVEAVNESLEKEMNEFNARRNKYLADSTAKAIADSIAKARLDSIAKAKRDSLERIRLDSIARVKYRQNTDWHLIPLRGKDGKRCNMKCEMCDETLNYDSYLNCFAIKNDSVYYLTTESLDSESEDDIEYTKYHVAAISDNLKNCPEFQYHMEIFSDSFAVTKPMTRKKISELNVSEYKNAIKKRDKKLEDQINEIRKRWPNGFVNDWGWDDEYSNVTFHIKYTNTFRKTIKYIEIYFKITNAVGDVRKTGFFKGTGPVYAFSSGEWEWDSSPYYVARDASDMEITKIILTFMDGTKKVIPKNQIMYEDSD